MAVARGYAMDDPGAPPLWPWRRVGRDIGSVDVVLNRSTDVGSDSAARFSLFEVVADALTSAAETRGLLVVLEDMHWADAASVGLMRHVAADLSSRPLVLVVTARDREVGPAWSTEFPALLRASGARSLVLSGLSAEALTEWLRSTPGKSDWAGYAQHLRLRTNGNPLYVDMLTSDPPGADGRGALDQVVAQRPDLRAVVLATVATLSPSCRATLEVAALLGERVPLPLLAGATGASVAVTSALITQAISAGVLRDSDAGPAFLHALVRDGIAAAIPVGRRAALHRAIALTLERDAADHYAGSIAAHWRLADGPDAAARCVLWSRRAAGTAAAGFDHDSAVAHADAAFRLAQTLGMPVADLAEVAVELAERQMAAGDLRAALDSCQHAADLAEEAGRPDLLSRAALVINGVGDTEILRVVGSLSVRAMVMLPADDTALRARLLAQQAVAMAETGAGLRAAALAAQALAVAEQSASETAELEALAARHLSITVPDSLDEREKLALRAIELGRIAASQMASVWGLLWMTEVHFQRGEIDRIDEELAAIEAIAERRRSPLARWHALRIRAARAALQGDFDHAYRLNDESLELAVRMEDVSMVGVAHAFTVALAVIRGDVSRVDPGVLDMFRHGPPLPLLRALLAVLLILLGKEDEAAGILVELRLIVDDLPVGPRWAGTLVNIGLAAALINDRHTAELVYHQLLPCAGHYDADGSGTIFSTGSNARLVGELALLTGRLDEAEQLFSDAETANVRIGAAPFLALSRLGRARVMRCRATGSAMTVSDPGDAIRPARELARQAAAEFRRLDMPGPLRMADELLLQLDGDLRRVNPLTVRESEIAMLIAENLSNKQIAARLVLSERTVESHVRNILAKLDLTRRGEIARWVHR